MPRAEQGLACFRRPACFHCGQDLVQRSALALGQRVRHAPQARTAAQAALARLQGRPHTAPGLPEATALGARSQAAVPHWAAAHHIARDSGETRARTRHPCCRVDAPPHTAGQVASPRQAPREAREACAPPQPLPARPPALHTVRTPIPALAALADVWGPGVQQDGAPVLLSPRGRQWGPACLRPLVYGDRQRARTRWRRRKAKRPAAWDTVRAALTQHAFTQRRAPAVLAEWQAWATDRGNAWPRAAAAVEGRTGSWSPRHHHPRGLPTRRSTVWTVLHNVDGRAADGTTPASRFVRRTFPDLFETVCSQIEALPQPRRRKSQGALNHGSHIVSRFTRIPRSCIFDPVF
jgi:hypothetical protein